MRKLDIDAEDWAELSKLLDAALELPVQEWQRWLATLSIYHEPLKPRLRELLSQIARAECNDFLRTLPKLEFATEGASARASALIGSSVGPYRLIRELGRGGMGSVWLAERVDGLINRSIALKIPHVVTTQAALAERMAREREILATLAHPNIARLYDAGVTAEGQPYLALEFIEGSAIDAYCNEHGLDVRGRLQQFLQVANAVAHAHAQLIIHRDLKPSNILVTPGGHVKLLDFGVAKLIDQGHATPTHLTEVTGRALTLDYASPEQIRAGPLSIATDIYSLGVVLYELLTGMRPYKPDRDSRGALEDAILHSDPARPSDAAPKARRAVLRGDLDTIILKALKKKPEERYSTVNELADDIIRYLRNRPVLARADSYSYRIRKFIARNKLLATISATMIVTVLGGTVVSARLAAIAAEEKQRAQELNRFLVALVEDMTPYSADGRAPSAREILELSAKQVEARLNDPVEFKVRLLSTIGSNLVNLQETAAAERMFGRAVSLATKQLGAEHPETLKARVRFTSVLRFRGQTTALRKELAALLPVLRRDPAMSEYLVFALRNLTHLQLDRGEHEAGIETAEEAYSAALKHLGAKHPQTITAQMMRALALLNGLDPFESLRIAEQTYGTVRSFYKADALHPRVIEARALYGRALAGCGDFIHGIDEVQRAVADATKLFGPRSRMVGVQLIELTRLQLAAGKVDDALANSARGLEIVSEHAEVGSIRHAHALRLRAEVLLAAGSPHQAWPLITAAERAYSQTLAPDNLFIRQAGELVSRTKSAMIGGSLRFTSSAASRNTP